MFGSDRVEKIAIVAVAGFLLFFGVVGGLGLLMTGWYDVHDRGHAEYEIDAERKRNDGREKIKQTCRDRTFESFSSCVDEQLNAYDQSQAASQDLEAQKQMAAWAKMLGLIAVPQLLASVGGIVLVWHSLKLNIDAVKAAKEANEVSRDVGRDQTRAYLGLKRVEWRRSAKTGIVRFAFSLVNSGATPCKRFSISLWLDLCGLTRLPIS
jgi:hypothetical protein